MAEQSVIDRLRSRVGEWWHDRRPVTEGHKDTARETGVMLGLMADASSAGPEMTDEQRLLLIQAAPGMRAREAVLLSIPNRSSVEENELHMIRREMARIEGRDAPQAAPTRVRGFLGPLAVAPGLGLLASPTAWLAVGGVALFGWGAWNGVQADRFRAERNEARSELASVERDLVAANAERDLLRDAASQAVEASRVTAANIEAERARRLRAEREARRIRDAMEQARAGGNVDYGFGGVRDAGGAPGSPSAGSSDSAGSRAD